MTRTALTSNAIANFQYCRAGGGCQSGQKVSPKKDSFMICRECHGLTCMKCDVLFHAGLTCDEYAAGQAQTRAKQQAAVKATMKKLGTKNCPNPKCRVPIQKISGCDHMKCMSSFILWICIMIADKIRYQMSPSILLVLPR